MGRTTRFLVGALSVVLLAGPGSAVPATAAPPAAAAAPTPTTVTAKQVGRPAWGTRATLDVTTTGADTGLALIRQGRGFLTEAAVVDGRARLLLPHWVPAGRNSYEVLFQPEDQAAASSATTAVVRVEKLRPRLVVRATGPRLRVRIGGLPRWDLAPYSIWVNVYDAARPRKLLTLKQTIEPRVRLTVPGLSPGRHRLRVEIPGSNNPNIAKVVRTVRVRT